MQRMLFSSAGLALTLCLSCSKTVEEQPAREPAVAVRAVSVPVGFQDQVVLSGLTQPTAVRFARDGRIFIAEKSGVVKVFDPSREGAPTVFADLRTNVYNYWDRGLLDLELHPDFPETPHIYVLYAYDAEPGGTAPRWGSPGATNDRCPTPPGPSEKGCVVSGRLSRLQAADGGMRGVEEVLIENWPQQYPSHSVGALAFGPDGMLYVSGGDGASFEFIDYGQNGDPPNPLGDPPVAAGELQTPPSARGGSVRAQNVEVPGWPVRYNGKVIRVDPNTGRAALGNPLAQSTVPGADAIIASGLRNPFRMAFRPGTNELWVGDVGFATWEEINRIADPAGASEEKNFGWPCYEGASRQPAYEALGLTVCRDLYAADRHVPPYFVYAHDAEVVAADGCGAGQGAVTGLAFYAGGVYPAEYRGALFFADYSRGCIWALMPGADGLPNPDDRRTFVAAAPQPVQLLIGPGNDLYYTSLSGELHRVVALGTNTPPVASLTATPSDGAVPLTVAFDASASSDADPGDTLTFTWDLDGDGAFDDAAGPTAGYVYSNAGERKASVRVADSRGAIATATQTITAGDVGGGLLAEVTAVTPQMFRVGETIEFSGEGFDGAAPLPAANLSWDLVVQHCPVVDRCHPHVVESFEGVASGSIVAPEHEYPYYLQLILRVSTADGRQATSVARLDPMTVEVALESDPPGLVLALNQAALPTPFSQTLVLGAQSTLSAPDHAGYLFAGWSDGGAQAHLVVVDDTARYRATYRMSPTPVQLAAYGSIIVRVPAGMGLGNPSPEVIRDDDYPVPGTYDPFRQYDTYTPETGPKDDWIGYEFTAPHAFSHVLFQEGQNFADGGWFEQLAVQVRRGGVWSEVANVTVRPEFPGTSNAVGYRSYAIDFETTVGDAIRIYGPAGGDVHFVSIAELDVSGWRVIDTPNAVPFARVAPAPALVLPGETVVLDGRESFDPRGETLVYRWSQTSGPQVQLNASASAPQFVAPQLTAAATLGFTLSVRAGNRVSTLASVEIVITPYQSPVDITGRGRIIASELQPTGAGNTDPAVIRDGIEPAPGSFEPLTEYNTFAADPGVVEGFIGYELDAMHQIGRLRFQEGGDYFDGGWFETLGVEVRQNGRWYPAPNLSIAPAYPGASDGVGYESFELSFSPTRADGVRVIGLPGGSARFFSVAELRVDAIDASGRNAAPIARAGADFSGPSGQRVSLDGSASLDPEAATLTYSWSQTAGPAVQLSSLSSPQPTFNVPSSAARAELVFSLTVSDGEITSEDDSVTVTILPGRNPGDITAEGAIICSVRHSAGFGNRSLEVVRDGVRPPLTETEAAAQYDTFTGLLAPDAFIGYQLPSERLFTQLLFQEGAHYGDGGWFATLTVQVRRAGAWRDVSGLVASPAYPSYDNGQGWETYALNFDPVVGDAIRIYGAPGGYWTFFTVAELRVLGY